MGKTLNQKCYFSFCGCNAKWLVHSDEGLATVCGHHLSMLIDALPDGASVSVISIEAIRKRDSQEEDPRLLQAIHFLTNGVLSRCPAHMPDVDGWVCPNAGSPGDAEPCTSRMRVNCWLKYLDSRCDMPTCRKCGCTDDHACDGGCSWVKPDLCSACAREVNS